MTAKRIEIIEPRDLASRLMQHDPGAALLIIEVPRADVEAGRFASVLDSLLELSQSADNTRRFKDAIALSFSGYDEDPRPLAGIPEVVTYFKGLHEAWPFWAHFLEKNITDTVGVTLAMIATGRGDAPLTALGPRVSAEDLNRIILDLLNGLNALYSMHGFTQDEAIAMTDAFMAAVHRFV